MGVNFAHLRLLTSKNIRLQIRSPIWLMMELLLPVLFILFCILFHDNTRSAMKPMSLAEHEDCTVLWNMKDGCCNEREVEDWMASLTNSSSFNVSRCEDCDEMKQELKRRFLGNMFGPVDVGLEIEAMDFGAKALQYKLLVFKTAMKSQRVDTWGPHLQLYGQEDHNVHRIQYAVETAFLQHVAKSTVLPTYMGELPRIERIALSTSQSWFYAICPAMFLLLIVNTTKNIVLERQTIKPYLSVMGLTTTTFYLSHCVVTLFEILLLSIAITVPAFFNLPNFPWPLAILTMILFSFSATAFAAMLASFFSCPSTAMQLCVSGWLSMSITPYFFHPSPHWTTGYACLQSLWPTYALHYIVKYLIAVSNHGSDINMWTGLVEPEWTGQITLGPLLVLAADPLLMIALTAIFEQRLFGRLFRHLSKRIQREDKSVPEVELLNDADETFDVDENEADIIVEDVYKEYPTGEKAVNGLNIKAHRGQVTVLLGHNGAGKTTTFSMICGVEDTTSGKVEICGYVAGSTESRRVIGYCAQANTLIDQMTVKDHLWLAHGLKQADGHYWDEGQQLLEALGLAENKKVSQLSGGQKRKLCVCMALIGDSRVVLLDEPTAGMDPESRRDVEKLLEEVKKDRTILLTTHYMDEAETLGDRIFIMVAGQTVCSGSPQFLKKRFGTGYLLTLVAAEGSTDRELAQQVEPLVQKYAASARLGEIRGKQVEIEIPVIEQQAFPDLFEHIEASQEEMHISSFGLSLNSLEQVFLRVSNLMEEAGEETDARMPLEQALENLYKEELHEGWELYCSQFRAVIHKKFIYSLRFWSQLVTQIGLPILSILVGLVMYTLADPIQTYFPIATADGEDMLMQNYTHSQETENFHQLLSKPGDVVNSSQELTTYLRANASKHFLFGVVFEEKKTTLLPNPEFPLSFATAINTLSRIRLPSANITASLDIFNPSDSNDKRLIMEQAVLMILLLTIMMCQFIVTLIEDRVSKFAHQQLLMGMKPTIYWLGDFIYCMVFFCFQTAVYVFSATFTGILSPLSGLDLFFMLLLYFWSTIPTVFVFSRFINSSSRGALVLWLLLFGSFAIVLGTPALMMMFISHKTIIDKKKWNPLDMTVAELVHLCLRLLFPTAPTFDLIVEFADYRNGNSEGDDAVLNIVCLCGSLFVTGAYGLVIFLLVQLRHIRYAILAMFKLPCARRHIPKKAVVSLDSVSSVPESEAMLETKDLCKVYKKNCALAHLTMAVKKNEIFGLLGVNGAGKTTAFNIITGQMFATKGTATIDGTDCRKDLILGFCPQFDAIHKDFTGREALMLLARIHGYVYPERVTDQVLDVVRMAAHADKRMYHCSGGQKRRISVAATLLPTQSRIIIMDEATAGIDPKARRDIWEVIAAVRNYSAVLMTSHSMDECEALCSRIGILKQGGLAAVGTSQTLKSKYGNFYTLTMALPSSDQRAEVADYVARWFPGSILKSDDFSLHLKWQVPKRPMDRWSTVFASCIELSERIGVPDFCLTQSTLQDIFLLLAGENTTSPAGHNSNSTSVLTVSSESSSKSVTESTKAGESARAAE